MTKKLSGDVGNLGYNDRSKMTSKGIYAALPNAKGNSKWWSLIYLFRELPKMSINAFGYVLKNLIYLKKGSKGMYS